MNKGQLVMLVKRDLIAYFGFIDALQFERDGYPPIGASGTVCSHCAGDVHVLFEHHKSRSFADGSHHVPIAWLIKIDDPDAVKAVDDQLDLDIGDGEKLTEKDLVKMGRKMLEESIS